jgi:hypothetical protein
MQGWLCTSLTGGLGPPDPAYQCTGSREFEVTAERDSSEILNPVDATANITFTAGGGLIAIAAFGGQGRCKLVPPGTDGSA